MKGPLRCKWKQTYQLKHTSTVKQQNTICHIRLAKLEENANVPMVEC